MKRIVVIISLLVGLTPGLVQAAESAPILKAGYSSFDRSSLTATSALVVDAATGEALFSHHADLPHSVASLTKLMSAIIFLEQKPAWAKRVALKNEDEVGGGRLRVSVGSIMTLRDLFYASLVGSANNTAMALMRVSGIGSTAFVREMNIRAATLGMNQTRFFEPTGMDPRNISTAENLAKLAAYAFRNPSIRQASTTGQYKLVASSPAAVRFIQNTNRLLVVDPDIYITGGKTGFLDESKYNIVIRARDASRREVIVVVLGADTRDHSFDEAKALAKWASDNYVWK